MHGLAELNLRIYLYGAKTVFDTAKATANTDRYIKQQYGT